MIDKEVQVSHGLVWGACTSAGQSSRHDVVKDVIDEQAQDVSIGAGDMVRDVVNRQVQDGCVLGAGMDWSSGGGVVGDNIGK